MTTGKHDFLTKELKDAIDRADRRRTANRQMASQIRLSVILSTAAIPVLLGLRVIDHHPEALANAALVLAALATALNAWEAFYGHKELWAVNTAAWSQLVGLQSKFEYLASGGERSLTDDALDKVHARLQEIQADADAAWIGVRHAGARLPPPLPASAAPQDK